MSFPGASICFQFSFLQCGFFSSLPTAVNQLIKMRVFHSAASKTVEQQSVSSVRLLFHLSRLSQKM